MSNGPETDQDMGFKEGTELAATIPLYQVTSLPFEEMVKLRVREDGFSDLPVLADSFIVVLEEKGGTYIFYRALKGDAPELGDVKQLNELQLQALKIRQNGLSDRPDLQGSHFEVANNEDGTYVVSRESLLNGAIECTAALTEAAKKDAALTESIPFNQQVFLSHHEMSRLKLDDIGCSELPEFRDSIFVGIRGGRNGYSLYRVALNNVPAIGQTSLMTAVEVSALRILPTGESDRADLQNSHFTWRDNRDFTFSVTRHRK